MFVSHPVHPGSTRRLFTALKTLTRATWCPLLFFVCSGFHWIIQRPTRHPAGHLRRIMATDLVTSHYMRSLNSLDIVHIDCCIVDKVPLTPSYDISTEFYAMFEFPSVQRESLFPTLLATSTLPWFTISTIILPSISMSGTWCPTEMPRSRNFCSRSST